MEIQAFAGNNLNRSMGTEKKAPAFIQELLVLESTRFVIVSSNKRGIKSILCQRVISSSPILGKISLNQLKDLLEYISIEDMIASVLSVMTSHDFIVLGREPEESGGGWLIAVNFSSQDSDLLLRLNQSSDEPPFFFDIGRHLLVTMFGSNLAIAGQALAMASWHDENRFCSKTGRETKSIESGLKRQSLPTTAATSPDQRKIYPRIDPVVIALIWSPDKKLFLLGNMTRSPSPYFYSCLSGFIEPCESIEEALCREVTEEAGVTIDMKSIQILRSQPWPIGRGGGCELMIGCCCVAVTTEIHPEDEDVREVRWFTREEVEQMIEASSSQHSQAALIGGEMPSQPFIPGPYAIAHHLLKYGVEQSRASETETAAAASLS
jgi:NADH pyrophosphatase NudC (nudix superfamily)